MVFRLAVSAVIESNASWKTTGEFVLEDQTWGKQNLICCSQSLVFKGNHLTATDNSPHSKTRTQRYNKTLTTGNILIHMFKKYSTSITNLFNCLLYAVFMQLLQIILPGNNIHVSL